MSFLQLARSRRIAIQFGEILLYIDTVSIGNRYICPFSHPFPVFSYPFPVLFHPFPVLFHITFHLKTCPVLRQDNGEGGIRTHGTPEGTTVFETVPIVHSGTSPKRQRSIPNQDQN